MNSLHQAIIFINSLSLGVLIPVFNLILLQKGSTLQTLPLLFAIYSTTILCMELPSGIFADIFGRKTIFLISCGFQLISFCLLLAAGNIVWLIAFVIFSGLGRAFSSGSLDALFIDQAIELHGEGCLAKVSSRMALLDGAGLAIGSIAGGIIAGMDNTYVSSIVLRIVFTILLFVLCLVLVKEKHTKGKSQSTSLMEHIRQSRQFVFSSPKFGLILIGVFFVGSILTVLETYWQPAFIQISPTENTAWMLGLITFSGFFAVSAGNVTMEKLLNKYSSRWWDFHIVSHFVFAGCLIIFAFQKNIIGFIAAYTSTYLLLGAGNVTENALTNKLTPNNMRASLLSFKSLIFQIGVLFASVFSSFMIQKLQIAGIWVAAGSLLGMFAIISALMTFSKERNKCSVKSIT